MDRRRLVSCLLAAVLTVGVSALSACGRTDPLDTLYAAHTAEVDTCLGYKVQAERLQRAAQSVLDRSDTVAKQAQAARQQLEQAKTVLATHEACVQRLMENVTRTAAKLGIDDDVLSDRWPGWYDERVQRLLE